MKQLFVAYSFKGRKGTSISEGFGNVVMGAVDRVSGWPDVLTLTETIRSHILERDHYDELTIVITNFFRLEDD